MKLTIDVGHKYMFTLSAPFEVRRIGSTPAGYRLDLEYRSSLASAGITPAASSEVTTDAVRLFNGWRAGNDVRAAEEWFGASTVLEKDFQERAKKFCAELKQASPSQDQAEAFLKDIRTQLKKLDRAETPWMTDLDTPWFGLVGNVASGVDWALLRQDAVIEFDGRFTLADPDHLLVNAQMVGSVDMNPQGPRPLTVDQAADRLDSKVALQVDFALSLRFEAAREPEPWAAKRYRRQVGQTRYIELSRGLFIGAGRMDAFGSSNSRFELDVFKVIPRVQPARPLTGGGQ